MITSKPEVKNLFCIFNFIINKYPESQLISCETKKKQRWRYALTKIAKNKITILANYFSELNSLLDSLENYSLCKKHYNNVVARDSFINQLKKANNLIFLDEESKRKRLKLSDNDNDKLQAYCNFEIQVSLSDPEYENKINELTHLNKQLLSEINELKHLNKQLLSENEILKKKLDSRFANQEDHIEAIIDIAKKE